MRHAWTPRITDRFNRIKQDIKDRAADATARMYAIAPDRFWGRLAEIRAENPRLEERIFGRYIRRIGRELNRLLRDDDMTSQIMRRTDYYKIRRAMVSAIDAQDLPEETKRTMRGKIDDLEFIWPDRFFAADNRVSAKEHASFRALCGFDGMNDRNAFFILMSCGQKHPWYDAPEHCWLR